MIVANGTRSIAAPRTYAIIGVDAGNAGDSLIDNATVAQTNTVHTASDTTKNGLPTKPLLSDIFNPMMHKTIMLTAHR